MVKAESNVNTMNSDSSIRSDTDFDKVEASMNKNGARHCENQRVNNVSNIMQNNLETINLDLPNLDYQPMETLPITPSTVKRISDVDAVMDQPQSDESILCKRSKRLKNKKGESKKDNHLHQHNDWLQGMRKAKKKRTQKTKQAETRSATRFRCTHCDYSTNRIDCFTRHCRIHTGEKPFVCSFEDCNERFADKSTLNSHIRRHIGDKRHKCSFCSKAFVTSSELTHHIRKHTGDSRPKCAHCKKRFILKANMIKHIKSHHPDTI